MKRDAIGKAVYLRSLLYMGFLFIAVAGSVEAGISVAPTVTEVTLDAGQEHTGILQVLNKEDIAVQVNVSPENWLMRVNEQEGDRDVSDWITVDPATFELGPQEIKEVTYRMKAPVPFKEERVAQVFFEFSSPNAPGFMRTRLGVIAYMTAAKGQLKGKITEFHVSYREVESEEGLKQGNCSVVFAIENTGEVHLRPFGDVIIRNVHTEEVVEHFYFEPGMGIFSQKQESYHKQRTTGLWKPGAYYGEAIIDIGSLHDKKKVLKSRFNFPVS